MKIQILTVCQYSNLCPDVHIPTCSSGAIVTPGPGHYGNARITHISHEAFDKSYASLVDVVAQHIRCINYLLPHFSLMCKVLGYMHRRL